jgi:hypothetical protein
VLLSKILKMNFFRYKIKNAVAVLLTGMAMASCNDYLDQAPLSSITPEAYLREESQLAAYAIERYPGILPSHTNWSFGTFGNDGNTDNMAIPALDNKYIPGLWRVGTGDANNPGDWRFENIFQVNYFLQTVVPRYKNGEITGGDANIRHYIGEMYFLRAHEYFTKLQAVGDFPIIRNTMPDNSEILTAASIRNPRNEVARFIISDLDSAALMMQPTAPTGAKTRLSKKVAQLLKSRVALYEGTWLKYFKGTALVPNGPEWPGKSKAYNANYQFPSGSIEGEIDFFLTQAMSAAKEVASTTALVNNTGIIESLSSDNPYFNMFSAENMNSYSEVLLWRQYNRTLVTHNVPVNAMAGNYAVGLTRSMVESFLMANGLPIYAAGSGYKGDDYITDVRQGRDGRLNLFLKEPGQKNVLINLAQGTHATEIEPTPQIWESSYEKKYSTGYTIRKGLTYDAAHAGNGAGYTGSITFRAVEAYLNYIEASYEKNGSLDGDARTYWQQIRTRAKVSTDIDATIAATQMNKETADWGAYSANQLVTPTLYNIRRERRSELMAEGLRYMDLKRWRAMDQMISTPYHVEGFKLWGPMKAWYTAPQLTFGATNNAAVVSDPALSQYLRPHQIRSNADSYKGSRWAMAHYLNPIAAQHFIITATGGDVSTSPIYQNPGWPLTAGSAPTGF